MPVYVRLIESAVNTERSWQAGELFECESEEVAAKLIEEKTAVPADVQPSQGVEQIEQPKATDEETKKAQPKATKSKGA